MRFHHCRQACPFTSIEYTAIVIDMETNISGREIHVFSDLSLHL